jgi:hypothetical protein
VKEVESPRSMHPGKSNPVKRDMKLRFLKKKTQSYLRKNQTPRQNEAYEKAVSFGLIFTVEDRRKHDQIKNLIRKLELDKKNVKALAFLPQNQENYEFLFDFFTYREVSFWGNITAPTAQSFTESSFDFLLYLDTTPNELILNLVARSVAKCRIGKYWPEGAPYFEMMIESRGDSASFIDDMYKYMKSLR